MGGAKFHHLYSGQLGGLKELAEIVPQKKKKKKKDGERG